MRSFAFSAILRPDIQVNGLESWLVSQLKQSFLALGDTSTKPFWKNRASTVTQLFQNVSDILLFWSENCWLVYAGLYNGMSLGTLQMIQTTMDDAFNDVWMLSDAADTAADEWKNVVSFFKCAELQPELGAPADSVPYTRNPQGMKIEAKLIRFKYDSEKGEEVLKGASFVINPGAMIAVVGYYSILAGQL